MRTRTLPLLAAIGAAVASVVVPSSAQAGGSPTPAFVFTSDRDGDTELFVRRSDGSTVQLTHNRISDFGAVWSPDGRKLAFSREYGGGTALFVMNADGSGVRRLTTPVDSPGGGPSFDAAPAWSPDGTRIAFASNRASLEPEIFRIDADGTGLRRLTRTEEFVGDFNPTWSPDGRWIWFDSDRVGVFNREVFRMRPDGTGVQRMTTTPDNVDDGAPDFSPDGRRVAFTSTRATGSQDLFAMDPDGTGVRRLTATAGIDEVFPRWTADGDRLLFWLFPTVEEPTETIWRIDADGTDRRQLTAGRANDSSPDPYPLSRR